MKKYTFRFRSIMVNHVEKVIPGTVFSRMVLEMDDTAVKEHTLELTLKDILSDKTWITNFMLSVMIVAAVSGIVFTGVYVGYGRSMEQSSWNIVILIFLVIDSAVILSLWIYLSRKVSIENRKRELVVQERGPGNWRLVDESEWNNFYRLLMIARNKRENDKVVK